MDVCTQILAHLCPDLEYTMARTSDPNGSDATYIYGQPPIVFSEETESPYDLKLAERDLHQKFAKISQYSRIEYVIDVAIAGDKSVSKQ